MPRVIRLSKTRKLGTKMPQRPNLGPSQRPALHCFIHRLPLSTIIYAESLAFKCRAAFVSLPKPSSSFVLSSACLQPQRNQGPSQCTRQTDRMAAGLKTIIALSFVRFTLPTPFPRPLRLPLSLSTELPPDPLPGPRHWLPPRHPLLRPLPQLPDPARRSDLRNRPFAKLDMREMCESR